MNNLHSSRLVCFIFVRRIESNLDLSLSLYKIQDQEQTICLFVSLCFGFHLRTILYTCTKLKMGLSVCQYIIKFCQRGRRESPWPMHHTKASIALLRRTSCKMLALTTFYLKFYAIQLYMRFVIIIHICTYYQDYLNNQVLFVGKSI